MQSWLMKIKSERLRKLYYSIFVTLIGIVVFCTVYALILPAITLTSSKPNQSQTTSALSYKMYSDPQKSYRAYLDYSLEKEYLDQQKLASIIRTGKLKNKTSGIPLSGAEFILYYSVISVGADGVSKTTTYYYAQTEAPDEDNNSIIEGWTTVKADATVLTSDTLGQINIQGIDSGTYYLEEIKAPAGYNLLTSPVTVAVTSKVNTATNTMTYSLAQNNYPVTLVKIENKTGNELPSTGGMGTTLFYIAGGVLVASAVIFLVTRKRMSADES